jgi:hypothetical protein
MAQLNYPENPAPAFAGMLADSGPHNILSYAAGEDIDFGVAVGLDRGSNTVFNYKIDRVKLLLLGTLVAGNTINLNINGVAINQVAFNTDSETTLDDLATEIMNNPDVFSANRNGLTVEVVKEDSAPDILINSIVIGGPQDSEINASHGSSLLLLGAAAHEHKDPLQVAPNDYESKYFQGDMVNVLSQGRIWVKFELAAENGSKVHVTNSSLFSTVLDGNYAVENAIFREGNYQDIVVVELNFPSAGA